MIHFGLQFAQMFSIGKRLCLATVRQTRFGSGSPASFVQHAGEEPQIEEIFSRPAEITGGTLR